MHDRTPPPDLVRSTQTIEKGHGRIETRQVAVSRECVAHLNWPGAPSAVHPTLLRRAWPLASSAQVCRIERTRERAGTISHEIAYAITSLHPSRPTPIPCWPSGAITGSSRTACTGAAMSPCARITASSDPAPAHAPWRPSETRCSTSSEMPQNLFPKSARSLPKTGSKLSSQHDKAFSE